MYYSDCGMKHVKLGEYQITEVITPSYPSPHNGAISCTLKFEAPVGLRPAIEFQHWDMANCKTDRIHVIDRKMGHHYKQFCGSKLPQPVTGTGQLLFLLIKFGLKSCCVFIVKLKKIIFIQKSKFLFI